MCLKETSLSSTFCDNCGGLQEAEKRMKIKRLPRILALHLKRFKYTEDLQRLQKLFHRVVYPYHLRLFNTTDDIEDPDRLYELYAVVVHIGGGPYHGHYVSIIKTEDRGWLLFDDEMVEPVDKSFVCNFFGDRPGLACAYVLFYRETTLEEVRKEQEAEAAVAAAKEQLHQHHQAMVPATQGLGLRFPGRATSVGHTAASPVSPTVHDPDQSALAALDRTMRAPLLDESPLSPTNTRNPLSAFPFDSANLSSTPPDAHETPLSHAYTTPTPVIAQGEASQTALSPRKSGELLSKKDRQREEKREEKERRAAEKEREKEREKEEKLMRKSREIKRRETVKKEAADLKAALEASKRSKAEEDAHPAPISGPLSASATPLLSAGSGPGFVNGLSPSQPQSQHAAPSSSGTDAARSTLGSAGFDSLTGTTPTASPIPARKPVPLPPSVPARKPVASPPPIPAHTVPSTQTSSHNTSNSISANGGAGASGDGNGSGSGSALSRFRVSSKSLRHKPRFWSGSGSGSGSSKDGASAVPPINSTHTTDPATATAANGGSGSGGNGSKDDVAVEDVAELAGDDGHVREMTTKRSHRFSLRKKASALLT